MPTTLALITSERQTIQEITLPSSWADVTLGEYLAMLAPQDAVSFELRLTRLKPEQLAQLEEGDRLRLLQRLDFVLDSQQLEEQLPTPGLHEVGNCAYGLFEQARKLLSISFNASTIEQGAILYSVFRNPTGPKAEPRQVTATYQWLLEQLITDVYADCLHFYHSYQRAAQGQPPVAGPLQPGLSRLEAVPIAAVPKQTISRRVLNSLLNR